MRHFHYLDSNGMALRITALRRPSEKTKPKRGTWVVFEADKDGDWTLPVFPEITWGELKRLEYLGSTPRDR